MSKNQPSALELVKQDIYNSRDAFQRVLVDDSISFEREADFASQLLSNPKNSFALGVARNNRDSVINAVINIASIGLSLNPALAHAYLVPRDGAICLDVSYRGFVQLAVKCGSIEWAQARVVHEKDRYIDKGLGIMPTHEFETFSTKRGEIIGVYVAAKLPGGDFLVETMTTAEINSVRDRSEYWKKKKAGPWLTDWQEMAKKTVVKRGRKMWPNAPARLDQAIELVNTDGGEGFTPIDDHNSSTTSEILGFDIDKHVRIALAQKSVPDLVRVYGEAMQAAKEARDRDGAKKYKAHALAQREYLRKRDADNTIDMEAA